MHKNSTRNVAVFVELCQMIAVDFLGREVYNIGKGKMLIYSYKLEFVSWRDNFETNYGKKKHTKI